MSSAQPAEQAPQPQQASSLAVLLLSAEGDEFPTALVDKGKAGGEIYSRLLHEFVRDRLDTDSKDVQVLVYFVA
ncbi:hypothetical protein JCM10207_008693 [Rhodosporidiobolus poonsookiae]